MSMRPFTGSTTIVAVGMLLMALGCTVLVQHAQLGAAAYRAKTAADEAGRLATAIADEKAARAETERRFEKQRTISNEAQRQLDHMAGNAAAATQSSERLFRQLDADLARARQAGIDPATVTAGPPAADSFVVSAELYAALLVRARRLDERARQFSGLADDRGIRGAACEREYGALTLEAP